VPAAASYDVLNGFPRFDPAVGGAVTAYQITNQLFTGEYLSVAQVNGMYVCACVLPCCVFWHRSSVFAGRPFHFLTRSTRDWAMCAQLTQPALRGARRITLIRARVRLLLFCVFTLLTWQHRVPWRVDLPQCAGHQYPRACHCVL
jgi:hypothetical protein